MAAISDGDPATRGVPLLDGQRRLPTRRSGASRCRRSPAAFGARVGSGLLGHRLGVPDSGMTAPADLGEDVSVSSEPPDDAYGRVTRPERYQLLHPALTAVVDRLYE